MGEGDNLGTERQNKSEFESLCQMILWQLKMSILTEVSNSYIKLRTDSSDA